MDDPNDRRPGGSAGDAAPGGASGGAPGEGAAPAAYGGAAGPASGQSSGQSKSQADKPSMLPALSVPKGGGAIKGIGEKFSVAAATGTASLSVPLPASPGRSGFGPQVGLSYDSGHGNGAFGLGFALSAPTITRKTDKGLPRYYDNEESDEYILSGAEDLVPNRVAGPDGSLILDVIDTPGSDHVVQQYRPRVEGLFARIERHTLKADGSEHWEVTTKDNVTHIYGQSGITVDPAGRTIPEPRIFDPKDQSRVFSWLLEQSADDRGNVVRYEYKAEDGVGVDPTKTSERSRFDRKSGSPVVHRDGAAVLEARRSTATSRPDSRRTSCSSWCSTTASTRAPRRRRTRTSTWPVRIDPFSTYRAGFEVRTYRLCQRVLMFHRLSDSRAPLLVRSTDFTYEPDPAFTYLTGVTQRGYIFDAAAR